MKHTRKLLSSLLAVCLLVGLLPWAAMPVRAGYSDWPGLSGSGTEQDPILITSEDDWLYGFVHDINFGVNADKYYKLTKSITVYAMAGDADHRFSGTFDGGGNTLKLNLKQEDHDGCAPFLAVENATIQNLTVVNEPTGSVYIKDHKYAASIAAYSSGTTNIITCRSTVAIQSDTWQDHCCHGGFVGVNESGTLSFSNCEFSGSINSNGNAYKVCHGGFVGRNQSGGTINFSGCVFSGKIDEFYGEALSGFVGWNEGAISYTDCMQSGTLELHKNSNIWLPNNATFSRGGTNTFTRTYYVTPSGVTQDEAIQVSASVPGNAMYSTITAADKKTYYIPAVVNGLYSAYRYSDSPIDIPYTVKAGDGTALIMGTDYTESISLNGQTVSEVREAGEYTLTLTGMNGYSGACSFSFTVSTAPLSGAGTAESPYIIANSNDWETFANVENAPIFWRGGVYVKLSEDFDNTQPITKMVGTSSAPFQGTFDGSGRTLTVDLTATGEYTAPFRYIQSPKGANDADVPIAIRNLKVAGTITTANKYAAGIAACTAGDVRIENCLSSVIIVSTIYHDGTHGGFTGNNRGKLAFEGCAFIGKLLSPKPDYQGTTSCGGFAGWCSDTTSFTNCLYAPADIEQGEKAVDKTYCSTFGRYNNASVTISNCYYTRVLGSAQGKQAYSITAGEGVAAANAGTPVITYNVSGITSYGTGILYHDVLYAGSGEDVRLTLSHADRAGYVFTGYTANAGTLAGTENPYTLTMPAADVNVSASFAEKTAITPSVHITGWTYGDAANAPSVSGNPGNGAVTYEYKVKGAADSTYTEAVPTDVGSYTVRATVAETDNYASGTATADFTISPRSVPTTATVDGDISGGTFVAKVIAPNGGLLIAAAYDGSGRQVSVKTFTITAGSTQQTRDTEIPVTKGYTYKVMLVDGSFVPQCAAWSKKAS